MKKLIFAFSIFAFGCSSNGNNPLSPSNSIQGNTNIETVDNRLPPVNYPDGISCPSAAPVILVQSNYNHIDVEWASNNKAHQVWIRVSRYSALNRMEFYRLVRENINKNKTEIVVENITDMFQLEVAYELSALCPILTGDTIPLSRKTVVIKGGSSRPQPVPPPVIIEPQCITECEEIS